MMSSKPTSTPDHGGVNPPEPGFEPTREPAAHPARHWRLSRRALLRGAGGVAVALPFLEIMGNPRPAHAAGTPARRFLAVYTPGGSVYDQWRPAGTETNFTLSPVLAPFAPVKDKLLVLDGLDIASARGEQDASGMVAWLTGTQQAGVDARGYAQGPSVDQVILGRLGSSQRALPSLSVAVRWGTGRTRGLLNPLNAVNFRDNATFDPIQPQLDPKLIWQQLFGTVDPKPGAAGAWDRSILDSVGRRYSKLARRLGAADRARLEQHLTHIRAMELQLASQTTARCLPPVLVDTSDYNPAEGLNSSPSGSVVNAVTDAAIPKVGKLMMDMMVMAMACDLTPVGTLQWSDAESKHTFPWLGLNQTHRFYQNDGGYHPPELARIATWYSEQHAYLLQKMAGVDMGGHSLLDESVVFFGSHIQNAATHVKTNMPFLLAGGGGGLRTGRMVRYDHLSHNNLLVSLLNLFGDTRTTFGNPLFCTGPLTNLT